MNPDNDSLESGYDNSAYSSSLEGKAGGVTTSTTTAPLPEYKPKRLNISLFKFNRVAALVTIVAIALIFVIGGGALIYNKIHNGKSKTYNSAEANGTFKVGSNLSVSQADVAQLLSIGQANQVVVNGQLTVNKNLVLTPTSAPSKPVAGEIYFDKNTNQPYYYNGSSFESLVIPQSVTSLGGASGAIGLGSGLAVNGGVLSISSSLLQSLSSVSLSSPVVNSIQGQSGNVTFNAGSGIGISGTTITNNGIINLSSTTGNLIVSNNGNGNYSLADSSVVNSGASGDIALITGAQTIDGSILSQSSNLITDTGSLTVNGLISTNTINQANTGSDITISAGANNNIQFTANGRTFTLPTAGPSSQVICTSGVSCAGGGGEAVQLQPGAAQIDTGTGSSIFINNTGGGNLIELQGSGSDKFTVDNSGNTNIVGTLNVQSTSLLQGNVTDQGNLTVQGSLGITVGSATNNGILSFLDGTADGFSGRINLSGALTSNQTYSLPTTGGTICLSIGNCAGAGGGITGSGTAGDLAVFTGGSSVGNSANISESGSIVTDSGSLAIQGSNSLTLGTASSKTGSIILNNATNNLTTTVQTGVPGSSNLTFTLPTSEGTSGQCLTTDGSVNGVLAFNNCLSGSGPGGGVASLNGLSGALSIANATGSGSTVTIQNASTSALGLSEFNSTYFSVSSGVVSLATTGVTAGTYGGSATGVGVFTVNAEGQISSASTVTLANSGLQNSSITINNSTNITGGGLVSLGGSLTLGVSNSPTFSGNLTVQGSSGITVGSTTNNGILSFLDGTSDGFTGKIDLSGTLGTNQTYSLPITGGTICVVSVNCASGAGKAVLLQPGSAQTDTGTGSSVFINNTGGGNLLELQGSGSDRFTIANNGNVTVAGSISSSSGTDLQLVAGGTNNIDFTADGRTFIFPTTGPGSQTICTTGISCASGGGQAVLLQPGSAQTDTGTGSSVFINNTGGGNLLELQGSGSDRFTVTNAGNTTIAGNLTVQGSSGITVGSTTNNGILSFLDGTADGFTGKINLSGALGSNQTYSLPTTGGTICLSIGNCAGAGGGITGSGTSGDLAVFTGSGTIGNSTNISESGTAVTDSGTLTIQGNNSLTLGTASSKTGSIILNNSTNSFTTTLTSGVPGSASNLTFTLPTSEGTSGQCLSTDGSVNGVLSFTNCLSGSGPSGGVSSLNGLSGALSIANATGSGSTVTIQNASTSVLGLSEFNSSYFSVSSGVVSLATTGVTAGTYGGSTTGAGVFTVNAEGQITSANTTTLANSALQNSSITINSSTNLSGGGAVSLGGSLTLSVVSSPTFSGNLTVQGSSGIIVGSTTNNGQLSFLDGTNDGFSGTVKLTGAIGANQTYSLPTTGGTICLSIGNCAGAGGGITGAGTAGDISVFTGPGTIGNSANLSESGSTVTDSGGLKVVTLAAGGTSVLCYNSSTNSLSSCGSSAGNGSYIYNQTAEQFNANEFIQGGAGTVTEQVQGAANQNVLNIYCNTGTIGCASGVVPVASFDDLGNLNAVLINGVNLSSNSLAFTGSADSITGPSGSNITLDTTGSATLNLGNTNATTINLGNSSSTTNINGGSGGIALSTGSTTGKITLTTNNASAGVIVKSSTNSGSAFQVQNASSLTTLSVNTGNNAVAIGNNLLTASPVSATAVSGGSLPANTTYYFRIVAVDSSNDMGSASSEFGGATTSATCTASGSCSISVGWTTVSGATSYRVYYGTSQGSEASYFTSATTTFTLTTTAGNTPGTPPMTSYSNVNQLTASLTGTNNLTDTTIQTAINSTSGFQLQNNAGIGLLTGDTTNMIINIGNGGYVPANSAGSTTSSLNSPWDVYVQGGYAYVVNSGGNNMTIYSISNPASPTLVGTVSTNMSGPQGVFVQGNYAYVANHGGSGNLTVYNISNPSSPVEVGSPVSAGGAGARTIYVQGNYAYVGNNTTNTVTIFNISNPANPVIVSTIPSNGTDTGIWSIFVKGNYAYISNQSSSTISIYNISNPASPTFVARDSTNTNGTESVFVQGNYAYSANFNGGGMSVINVSNPASPTTVGNTSIGSSGPASIYVQGNYAYVANSGSGGTEPNTIAIVNISNPASPTPVGYIQVGSGNTAPKSVFAQGNYVYVVENTNPGALAVYNVGGAYIQQLQAGGLETTTLQVDSNSSISGDENIQGGLTVGTNAQIDGQLGVAGPVDIQNQSNTTAALQVANASGTVQFNVDTTNSRVGTGQIGIPTNVVATTQSGGSLAANTTYYFKISAVDSAGGISAASSEATASAATSFTCPGSGNCQVGLTWTAVSGAYNYNIYYGTSPGAENNYMTTFPGNAAAFTFSTTTGNIAGTPPTTSNAYLNQFSSSVGTNNQLNSTNIFTATNSANAFNVQNNNGTSVLNVSTSGSSVTIKSPTNTTTAFQVQTSGGVNLIQADTNNSIVYLAGNSVATVDIGSVGTSTNTSTVNIGTTTGAAQTVSIGSVNTSSTTSIVGGTGGLTLQEASSGSINLTQNGSGGINITGTSSNIKLSTNSSTAQIIAQSNTNNVGAFQVQNSSGSTGVQLNSDTINNRISTGQMAAPSGVSANTVSGGSLAANLTYRFKITARDTFSGETAPSSEATASAATSATCTGSGSCQINVTWTALAGATSYRIYYGTSSGAENNFFTSTTNSFTFSTTTGNFAGSPPTNGSAYVNNLTTSYSNGTNILTNTTVQTAFNSTTGFSIQNAAGTSIFTGDTTNNRIDIVNGLNSTATSQFYIGDQTPNKISTTAAAAGGTASAQVQGNYAYVINWCLFSCGGAQGLYVYDVSNPASPVFLKSITGLSISLYSKVFIQGNYAYISGNSTFYIYNIANPDNPTQVAAITSGLAGSIRSVYVQGNYAYITDTTNGLIIYNVSNPASPTQVASITTGLNQAYSVYVQGSYAYVASNANSSLVIFNVANPASPTQVGTVSTALNNPTSVYVQGRYAYVASASNSSLVDIDVSNPASPTEVGALSTSTQPNYITVQGRYAYLVGITAATMVVADISNPASPSLAGSTTTGLGSPESIVVQGRYAYVGDTNNGLINFDLGGSYIQQMQTGGIDTGTLTVDTSGSINGDLGIQGGLTVGQNTELNGSLGVAGNVILQDNGNSTNALQVNTSSGTIDLNVNTNNGRVGTGQISAPTFSGATTTTGGSLPATTTYSFKVTAVDASGSQSAPSGEITAGATSGTCPGSGSCEVTVNWNTVAGAVSYDLYYGTSVGGEANFFNTGSTNGSFTFTSASGSSGTPPATGYAFVNELTASSAGTNYLTTSQFNGNVTVSSANVSITNSGSGGTVSLLSQSATNTNTTASSSTVNGDSITLTGTNNSNVGANVLNGINFNNVTAATNNTFNGLYFGSGYTNDINLTQAGSSNLLAAANYNLVGAGINTTGSFTIQASAGSNLIISGASSGSTTVAQFDQGSATAPIATFLKTGLVQAVQIDSNGNLNLGSTGNFTGNLIFQYSGSSSGTVTINSAVSSSANSYTLVLPTTGPSGSLGSLSATSNQCLQDNSGSSSTVQLTFGNCSNSHSKTINLSAEYAGAVLDATNDANCSSNNIGTMISGYTGDTTPQNYYEWNSTQTALECYDIVVQVPIPSDWSSWNGAPTIYGEITSSASVHAEFLNSSGTLDSTCSGAGANGSGTKWCNLTLSGTYGAASGGLSALTNGNYSAGQTMTIKLEVSTSNTGAGNAFVGNISIPYTSAY